MNSTSHRHRHAGAARTVFLFAVALFSFNAHAEVDGQYLGSQDAKFYSGAICSATRHADLLVTKNGVAQNSSTSLALDITCPLERDMTNTQSVLVKLWVYKVALTGSMTCFLNSRHLDNSGGSIDSKPVSGTGLNVVTLGLVKAHGTYSVGCNVPKATRVPGGRSGILSIEMLESN